MTRSTPQATLADQWLADLRALQTRTEQWTALDDAQLSWSPPEGGWGAGQVAEHVVVANELYVDRMRAFAEPRTQTTAESGNVTWRATLAGAFLANALRSPRKLPAPRVFRPATAHRTDVMTVLANQWRDLAALLHAVRSVTWRRARMTSPASSLIRLNLGDCFAVLIRHGERHAAQIERVLDHAAFPSASGPPAETPA